MSELEVKGAPFHDVPRTARWIDHLVAKCMPSLAGILVARGVKPPAP